MIENYFIQLEGTLENCKTNVVHEKFAAGGSRVPVSLYELLHEYKGHTIELVYELGNHNLARVEVNLGAVRLPFFLITNKSHFSRLFSSKGNILKVECKHPQFKKYLEEILISTGLEQIARDNLFEPRIETKTEKNEVKIIAGFYLGFEDKIGTILPLLDFYKQIIDYGY